MRNTQIISKSKEILSLAEKLPYFRLDNLSGIKVKKNYLKILFSRSEKSKKVIRLKKGIYVTRKYIDDIKKKGEFDYYPEFLSDILYSPSYLSLDYVLYEKGLLTELPKNFTAITKKKTAHFSNEFGHFFYHKIKDEFFCGFEQIVKGDLTICKATTAKALFDWVYLKRNFLSTKKSVEELRINITNMSKGDIQESKKYLRMAKSKKLNEIFYHLLG